MKNLMKKIIVNILIIAIFCTFFQNMCMAEDDAGQQGEGGGKSFQSYSIKDLTNTASDKTGTSTEINKVIQGILVIAQVIAVGIAIIMLIVLAIKYMGSAPGEKAEIKKNATIYIVGAIILFAVSGILQIIKLFANNINNEA